MKKIFFLLLLTGISTSSLIAQTVAWPSNGTNPNNWYNSSNGNTGIGTNNPGCTLDVNGWIHSNNLLIVDGASANNPAGYFRGPSTGSGNVIFQGGAGNWVAFWISGANGFMKLGGQGGSEPSMGAINIDLNGNVAVGTLNTSSGYKFAVKGTAVFDGVTVTTFSSNNPKSTPWADYVFDKNYKLPSLQNLAVYIKANGHLPGIPTTAEVQKNGLDLGTTQAKLLEKIEQLTLYTIDLQQQADELKKQVETLSADNRKLADMQAQIDVLKESMAKAARTDH